MRRERGSVSVVIAAVVLLALVLSLGVADVAQVLVARSRARTAADAAALAVAQDLVIPSGVALSEIAANYAALNGAPALDMRLRAGHARGDASRSPSVSTGSCWSRGRGSVQARARAVVDLPEGPADPWGPVPDAFLAFGLKDLRRAAEDVCGMRVRRGRITLVCAALLCGLLPLATSELPPGRRHPAAAANADAATQHPADRQRRPGVVDVLARPDAERLQPVGGPGCPVQAGVREHVALLSLSRPDPHRPLRAQHGRRCERGHFGSPDVPAWRCMMSGYRTMLAGKYLNSWPCDPRAEFDRWVCVGYTGTLEQFAGQSLT